MGRTFLSTELYLGSSHEDKDEFFCIILWDGVPWQRSERTTGTQPWRLLFRNSHSSAWKVYPAVTSLTQFFMCLDEAFIQLGKH